VDIERRKGYTPIPDNLEVLLNEQQFQALPSILRSGWELRFLRRPLFQEPVFVLHHPDGNRTGILDTDGRVKIQPELKMRGQEFLLQTIQPDKPLVWTK
jgi:hypothetical protein